MARLMWICGILLVAAGVALGVVLFAAVVFTRGRAAAPKEMMLPAE